MNNALRQNIKLFNKQNIINGLLMYIKKKKCKKINSKINPHKYTYYIQNTYIYSSLVIVFCLSV